MAETSPDVDMKPFKPVWWAFNAHVHTIVPSQFMPVKKPDCTRVKIPTPDDDFLEIDVCRVESDKPVVALFHGLEGSTDRYYIGNAMSSLKKAGYSSVALNFRGCGSRLNRQRRFYHSGETKDYQTFIKWISNAFGGRSIYAVGYSLGGNALIKYLAEYGTESKVQKAVAVSPPYDLKAGSLNLQKGFNRIYEINFLKTLVNKLEKKREQYSDLPEFEGSSLYDFDDQVTAPLHGFKNADDYYRQCSSKLFLKHVTIPLMLIHSRQDPLCPLAYAPMEHIKNNGNIHTCFTQSGGHVGFLSQPPNWLPDTITGWFEG